MKVNFKSLEYKHAQKMCIVHWWSGHHPMMEWKAFGTQQKFDDQTMNFTFCCDNCNIILHVKLKIQLDLDKERKEKIEWFASTQNGKCPMVNFMDYILLSICCKDFIEYFYFAFNPINMTSQSSEVSRFIQIQRWNAIKPNE